MEDINNMLKALSEAPDGQIDKTITEHLKGLIGKSKAEIKTGVMYAIDQSVHGSLVSGFGLEALVILHEAMLGGSSADFTDENCPWRKTS